MEKKRSKTEKRDPILHSTPQSHLNTLLTIPTHPDTPEDYQLSQKGIFRNSKFAHSFPVAK